MKVKKYLYITAGVSISFCAVVFGLSRYFFHHYVFDALTRPTEDTALYLLKDVKGVWVEIEIRSNVPSYKEQLSNKNFTTEITKLLDEHTDVVLKDQYNSDGDILVDIQLKGRKETEFVAASIAVSVANTGPDRSLGCFTGIIWQSQKTLLVHKNEIMEEVPKNVLYLVRALCGFLPHTKRTQKAIKEWKKAHQNNK